MKTAIAAAEQETIINFNKGESTANVFTYEKTWQDHLEKRLGLKPTLDNGRGGRGYEIDKRRIPMPRAPRRLSDEYRQELGKRLARSRAKRATSLAGGM